MPGDTRNSSLSSGPVTSERHAFSGRIPGRDRHGPPFQADQPSWAFPGIFEVGVHIADVSYFVPEGSELDKVAAERATSVYLVQKVKVSLQFLGLKNVLLFSRLLCVLFCLRLFKQKIVLRNSNLV